MKKLNFIAAMRLLLSFAAIVLWLVFYGIDIIYVLGDFSLLRKNLSDGYFYIWIHNARSIVIVSIIMFVLSLVLSILDLIILSRFSKRERVDE